MTASTVNAQSNTTTVRISTVPRRSAVDTLIERAARGLLAWSDRRANQRARKHQLTHERVALLLESQRNASRGGSALGR